MMINLKQYKSILCLNGDLPPREFFDTDLPIIAADGAANTLVQMNLIPQIVIGDLDSINTDNLLKLNTLLHEDQDLNDFQKALAYLNDKVLLPTLVLGVNGGFLDHILNNINIIITHRCDFYDPSIVGLVLREGDIKSLSLPLNTKLSLFGIPSANITTNGLKWELNDYAMSFPGTNSCYNRSMKENVTITVHSGNVLIIIYQINTL